MSRVYAKRFSLQCEEHETSLLPARAQAVGEAVLLPAVSKAVGETAQGRRRRLFQPLCSLWFNCEGVSPAQPSPLLPHPLIHKGKRWECQKQTLNMEIAMHTEWCSHPIPTITDTNQQITALWSQQLVQSPNTAAYSSSKHTQTLPHAGILQSIQSVSIVISIIYSKLFLELAEIRPLLCPNTAEAHLCTREHLLWLCKSEGCDGGFLPLSSTQ